MGRPKKDNYPVTIRIATTVYERLNAFCERSGQSKTTAFEEALTMYLDSFEKDEQLLEEILKSKNK